MTPLRFVSGVVAPVWRAFRWLVPAPGIWRLDGLPTALLVVRAVVMGVAIAVWAAGMEAETFNAVGAAVWGVMVGAMFSMQVTLIQMMAQSAIHDR